MARARAIKGTVRKVTPHKTSSVAVRSAGSVDPTTKRGWFKTLPKAAIDYGRLMPRQNTAHLWALVVIAALAIVYLLWLSARQLKQRLTDYSSPGDVAQKEQACDAAIEEINDYDERLEKDYEAQLKSKDEIIRQLDKIDVEKGRPSVLEALCSMLRKVHRSGVDNGYKWTDVVPAHASSIEDILNAALNLREQLREGVKQSNELITASDDLGKITDSYKVQLIDWEATSKSIDEGGVHLNAFVEDANEEAKRFSEGLYNRVDTISSMILRPSYIPNQEAQSFNWSNPGQRDPGEGWIEQLKGEVEQLERDASEARRKLLETFSISDTLSKADVDAKIAEVQQKAIQKEEQRLVTLKERYKGLQGGKVATIQQNANAFYAVLEGNGIDITGLLTAGKLVQNEDGLDRLVALHNSEEAVRKVIKGQFPRAHLKKWVDYVKEKIAAQFDGGPVNVTGTATASFINRFTESHDNIIHYKAFIQTANLLQEIAAGVKEMKDWAKANRLQLRIARFAHEYRSVKQATGKPYIYFTFTDGKGEWFTSLEPVHSLPPNVTKRHWVRRKPGTATLTYPIQ